MRRLPAAVLLAALVTLTVASGSGAALAATARDPGGSVTLRKGAGERDRVLAVQELFAELGYPLGRERGSGRFGVRTQGAVRYLQRSAGLPATGAADRRTLAIGASRALALSAPPPPAAPVPTGVVAELRARQPEAGALLLLLLVALLAAGPWRARSSREPVPRGPVIGDAPALDGAPHAGARLGEVLCSGGALSEQALAAALEVQRRSGGRLGAILVGTGAIDGPTLRAARAVQTGLPPVSAAAVATPLLPADHARTMRAVALESPAGADASGRVLVALADPSPDALRDLSGVVGGPVEPLVVDEPSLVCLLEQAYREEDSGAVAQTLVRRRRDGALRTLGALAIAAAAIAAGLLDPRALLAASAAAGALVLLAGAHRQSRDLRADAPERPAVTDADLPSCTVVVPLSRARADTLATCWRTLADLRYPVAQLQGIAVIAADDDDTLAAYADSAPPPWMQVVLAPAGTHRAALALHGLRNAWGTLSTVVDPRVPPQPDDLLAGARLLAGDAEANGRTGRPARRVRRARPGRSTGCAPTGALHREVGWHTYAPEGARGARPAEAHA